MTNKPSFKKASLEEITDPHELEGATGGDWTNPSCEDMRVMGTREFQSVQAHWRSTRNGVSQCEFNRMGWREYQCRYM
jgi:hypothetical protein